MYNYYTEIGFFLEQLRKNTPSALEVLFTTDPEHVFNKSKLPEKPDKEFFKNYILNFYE